MTQNRWVVRRLMTNFVKTDSNSREPQELIGNPEELSGIIRTGIS